MLSSFIHFCSYCVDSSLNKTKATGKVLVCRHAEYSSESKLEKSRIVKQAGAVGMILIDEANQGVATPFVIPSAIVGTKTGERILSYINNTRFVVFLYLIEIEQTIFYVLLLFFYSLTQHRIMVNSIPMSRISRAKTVLGVQPAPRVAAFSSKGPNALTPEILKVILILFGYIFSQAQIVEV